MKNNANELLFKSLKTQFYQAPLPKDQLDELIRLAKTYDKKLASYLEAHYSELAV